jgi:hypothetical protein
MAASPTTRVLVSVLTYVTIVVVTLALVDVACNVVGIFPPARNPGDAQLGWLATRPTGEMAVGKCRDLGTGETVLYQRNEDGVRTSVSRKDTAATGDEIRIAVTGDSHTDLCSANEELHSGVLQTELRSLGVPATTLNYGVGRYSPLQDYLAFRKVLRPYNPRVLVLNLYTGNDFYDMLRVDDRPHFIRSDSGYHVAPPVWYTLDDPAVQRRSRVLAFGRALGDRTGVRTLFQRFSFLRAIGGRKNSSLANDISYMKHLIDAREPTLGYPDALTAQMLNQQLFFHHFPAARDESLRRVRAVLALAREENPGLLLVLSPIPSYMLVGASSVDSALIRTTSRLPVTLADGIREEQALYDSLGPLAEKEGWLFVDNLSALRAYKGSARLYNDFDYHLERVASSIIGRSQRDVLLPALRTGSLPGL